MRSNKRTFYAEDLGAWGFTQQEIDALVQKDVIAAAKKIENPVLFTFSPKVVRWLLYALEHKTTNHPCEGIDQENLNIDLKFAKAEFAKYPAGLHGRIIEAIYKDLPEFEIECNKEREEERLCNEWTALLDNKTTDEIRAMITQVKACEQGRCVNGKRN
ncbi:MAG: hypothetical protein JW749_03665 [Sedimentisphaerales bacterium]|nr:hypothetical protein [Sedimentisphaerales bacterium]